ncbi:hypothetical protein GCM10010341_46560 [Streptomyces noursei]|nr:hypothetical protein GCM10010341_46560 [Streptomyces noursei]
MPPVFKVPGAPPHLAAGGGTDRGHRGDVGRLRARPASTCVVSTRTTDALKWGICAMGQQITRPTHGAEGKREERLMIAKLLAKLSFTRNYGAYGAHDWGTHTGDDRV